MVERRRNVAPVGSFKFQTPRRSPMDRNLSMNTKVSTKKIIGVLVEAKDAIGDELGACGLDEINDHPVLKRHARIYDKIERLVATLNGAAQKRERE
jgi:hypothetical protein